MEIIVLASGSKGNATYIQTKNNKILLDAGISYLQIKNRLLSKGILLDKLDAILITHEHRDHISNVAALSKRYHIPVFGSELTWKNLPFYDDYLQNERHIFKYGMEIGDIGLDFFRLSHDAIQPVGLVFAHKDTKIGIATDTGTITPSMYRKLKNLDALVFEANHDRAMLMRGSYPMFLKQRVASEFGHLSNTQAAMALTELIGEKTKHIILAHLSDKNNTPYLALKTVTDILNANGVLSTAISIAPRKEAHPLIHLE